MVMVLNICKYCIPHLEYNLFKGYIAENLCVKRNVANNDCNGKCFLEKTISSIIENDNQDISVEKQSRCYDAGDFFLKENTLSHSNPYIEGANLFFSGAIHIKTIIMDVPVPPPEPFRFTSYITLQKLR